MCEGTSRQSRDPKNSTVHPPPPFDGETVNMSPVYGFWPPINNLLIQDIADWQIEF